jgi:hypothetical protein
VEGKKFKNLYSIIFTYKRIYGCVLRKYIGKVLDTCFSMVDWLEAKSSWVAPIFVFFSPL